MFAVLFVKPVIHSDGLYIFVGDDFVDPYALVQIFRLKPFQLIENDAVRFFVE
jgi:hypothetical protein